MSTVCPGSTTFAASWTVQNGSACVPGPLSLHVPLNSTYRVVPGAVAGVAVVTVAAVVVAAWPPATSAARADWHRRQPNYQNRRRNPGHPTRKRTPRHPYTKVKI